MIDKMRKTICNECMKEIKVGEEYYSVVLLLEKLGKNRRVDEIDEEELQTLHKKCWGEKRPKEVQNK